MRAFDVQSHITLLDMSLHTRIDLYLSMFPRLLLIEGKAFAEYLFPRKTEKIADAQSEKRAAGDKKAHPVFAILEQSSGQVPHRVPRQIIRCCA